MLQRRVEDLLMAKRITKEINQLVNEKEMTEAGFQMEFNENNMAKVVGTLHTLT